MAFPRRLGEGEHACGHVQGRVHLVDGYATRLRDLLWQGLAPQDGRQGVRGAHACLDPLDHVDGNTNGLPLVCERPRDALSNPPSRIGTELTAAMIIEFVDGPHQADIALLYELK